MVKDYSDSERGNPLRHIGYSYRLTARVLLYAPSHRQDNTYHGLGYTSRVALAGTRNSSMGPPHEGRFIHLFYLQLYGVGHMVKIQRETKPTVASPLSIHYD